MNNSNPANSLTASLAVGKPKKLQHSDLSLLKYRFMVFYRFLLAIVGGYALASLTAMVVAQAFSEYRAAAVMSATLLAFSMHCAAFIWVFMVHKTLKATLGIILPCLLFWAMTLYLGA